MVKYGPTGGDWKAYSVLRRKRCPKFCQCTYLKCPCSRHAFVHTENTRSHALRQLQRKIVALLTCWMWEHLPCHRSVDSLECNLSYRAQFQEILSQKPCSFISVSYLLLHNSTSCTTFDLFALQTVADHSQCSFLHRTVVFSPVSLSTMASLYSRVWPEKHSHMKKNICHALYFGKSNQTIHFQDMILQQIACLGIH